MGLDDYTASDDATAQCSVGLYAMSVYEFLLLLDDEYRLVYRSDWNIIKIIYLICRFMVLLLWPIMIYMFVSGHDGDACSPWVFSQSVVYIILLIFPHCLLLSRTWVFTGRSKWLMWIFSIMFFGYLASMTWASALYTTIRREHGSFHACTQALAAARHRLGLVVFGGIGMDVTAGVVAIYCYIRNRDNQRHLFGVFFKQAIGYVFLMVLINAFTTYSNVFMPAKAIATHPMTIVIPNLLACRFILELRKEVNPTDTQISEELSAIVNDGLGKLQQDPSEPDP